MDAEDEEGRELPDLAAARRLAIDSARDMICADVRQGWLDLEHEIVVADESGEKLLVLRFGEAFELRGKD